jgi:dihydroflavonol-4-reductase
VNAYGKSKVICEQLLIERMSQAEPHITIIRPSITYGRRDPTGMVTKLAMMIDRGIYATVGTGDNRVQLAHISDITQGFIRALGNPKAFERDYIITAKSPIRINQLVELAAREMGKPAPRFKIPRWAAYSAAVGLEGCYAAKMRLTGREPIVTREKIQMMTVDRHYSIARAMDELSYTPAYDYADGIRDCIHSLCQDGVIKTGASCN